MFSCEAIWVIPVGQEQHFDVHPLRQHHVGSSQCGMYSCLITIIQQDHIFCEPMQQSDLENAKSGARIGNNIFNTTLMHGDYIGITLHHIDAIFFGNGFLGLKNTIEFVILVIH